VTTNTIPCQSTDLNEALSILDNVTAILSRYWSKDTQPTEQALLNEVIQAREIIRRNIKSQQPVRYTLDEASTFLNISPISIANYTRYLKIIPLHTDEHGNEYVTKEDLEAYDAKRRAKRGGRPRKEHNQ
jgi:hypothetical protein